MDQETGGDIAFAARCLLRGTCWATLATQREGQPFTALVTHAIAPDGAVLMLISAMAEHTRQLAAEPRCALMVTGKPENLNWQTAPRVSVTGRAVRLEDRDTRRYWVAHHPYARLYADFADFSVWRVVPDAGLFVAGFGRIHPLSAAQLVCPAQAVAAVAAVQEKCLAHCNTSLAGAIAHLAHEAGESGRWAMLCVDPDGFDLAQDEKVLRIAWDRPVSDAATLQSALSRLLKTERNVQFMG